MPPAALGFFVRRLGCHSNIHPSAATTDHLWKVQVALTATDAAAIEKRRGHRWQHEGCTGHVPDLMWRGGGAEIC